MVRLQDVYANDGYAYSEIKPIIKEDDEKHLADITYHISKGPKVRFERITITGNKHTRDKVIRRELKVMEGDYFSGQGMKRSTENLRRLGFFEDVQFHTKKGSRDDLMDLNVDVKEKGTRTFSVGAGYSSAYSAFVTFQVSDENFMGYGQRLTAAARIGGSNTHSMTFGFWNPGFLIRVFPWGPISTSILRNTPTIPGPVTGAGSPSVHRSIWTTPGVPSSIPTTTPTSVMWTPMLPISFVI